MSTPSLSQAEMKNLIATLDAGEARYRGVYPGEPTARQPVHTVYGGAQLFKADTAPKIARMALNALSEHSEDAIQFAKALGLAGSDTLTLDRDALRRAEEHYQNNADILRAKEPVLWLALCVFHRTKVKLTSEAVEDFRIDFEDGFGIRPDAEEDQVAVNAARETAAGLKAGTLPPFIGIRIKSLNAETRLRGLRTLDIYVTELVRATGGALPANFVVTLPKITAIEQVAATVAALQLLEGKLRLAPGVLKLEVMIETTQSLFDSDGRLVMTHMARAAGGRLTGAHFGVYDYTATCQITAAHQAMDHPACDFARQLMKIAFAGQPVFLSDGATNVMPVGTRDAVHKAWRLNFTHVRHSLQHAFYQGWDLHPSQLPVRYAACYSFFLEGLEAATLRLTSFIAKAAQATLLGEVFDDAATGQGLLNYFLRAVNCGAITKEEVLKTGLTWEDVMTRSFMAILARRK